MCRWAAYSGSPVPVEKLLYGPEHSIVAQSLTSFEGAETTNGDGFGVGWWADGAMEPSRYRSTEPAWNDLNLRDIVGQLWSRMVFMHVRASSGSPVQKTNCHPFRHGRLLFMHNGVIEDFARIRRRLLFELDEELFELVDGSTDSEVLFYLAVQNGLETDPRHALELAVGQVEDAAIDAGLEPAIQMSVAVGNGEWLCGARYATRGEPRTLYHTADIRTLRSLYPDVPRFQMVDEGAHALMSEPATKLPGVWHPVPAGSFIRFEDGEETIEPFVVSHGAVHA